MSKAELLEEFTKLTPAERSELWDALWILEEQQLMGSVSPTLEEKTVLDSELKDFQNNPQIGTPWSEIEPRLRNKA